MFLYKRILITIDILTFRNKFKQSKFQSKTKYKCTIPEQSNGVHALVSVVSSEHSSLVQDRVRFNIFTPFTAFSFHDDHGV